MGGLTQFLLGGADVDSQVEEKLGEKVLAACELRQGQTPSSADMKSGAALMEVLRPRRSKLLPRRFVLAATDARVVAFKAMGMGSQQHSDYKVLVRGKVCGSWPRDQVRVTDLPEGPTSKGGTLHLAGEAIPVFRPNLSDNDPRLFSVLLDQAG